MLRVFSPTGTNVIFLYINLSESRILIIIGFHGLSEVGFVLVFGALSARFLNQDLQDFQDYCRGELNSPSHDTDPFPYFSINIVTLRQLKSIS